MIGRCGSETNDLTDKSSLELLRYKRLLFGFES